MRTYMDKYNNSIKETQTNSHKTQDTLPNKQMSGSVNIRPGTKNQSPESNTLHHKAGNHNQWNNSNQKIISQQPISQMDNKIDEFAAVFFNDVEMQIENIHVTVMGRPNAHFVSEVTGMVKAGNYDEYVIVANKATEITIEHSIKGKRSFIFEGKITFIEA